MRILVPLVSILFPLYALIRTARSSPDIAKLEDDQNILLNALKRNADRNKDFYDKFKYLGKKDNTKSLNSVTATIPVGTDGDSIKVDNNYSPPIIVLLPEDSTSREKWEYAVTLKCLGQNNFDAFTNIHNTRMARMASISGSTVAEINSEIKETEQELVKKELEAAKQKRKGSKPARKDDYAAMTRRLHLDHNIKLLNQEIHVMEVKLERLQKRLKSAVLFGKSSGDKGKNEESGEGEYGDEEAPEDGGDEAEENEEDYD